MTAVAAGALSQYLRYLLQSAPAELQPDRILHGPNLLMVVEGDEYNRGPQLKPRLRFMGNNRDGQLLHRGLGMQLKRDGDGHRAVGDDDPHNMDQEEEKYYEKEDDAGGDWEDADDGDNDVLEEADEQQKDDNYSNEDGEVGRNGDEEYGPYVDNDEGQGAGLKVAEHPKFAPAGFHKSQRLDEVNSDQETYKYWDNSNNDNNNMNAEKLAGDEKSVMEYVKSEPVDNGAKSKTGPNSSVGSSYMFVLSGMILLLFLMYRFVRRRRILIRYR